MTNPIEDAIARIPLEPVVVEPDPDNGLPTVTHQGVFRLVGHDLRVYQLSDGRRVIHAEDVERLFGFTEGTRS